MASTVKYLRWAAPVAAGLLAAFTLAGAAPAGAGPGAKARLSIDPIGGHPAKVVTVSGSGLPASTRVLVDFDGVKLAPARTGATGSFAVEATVPASALPGTHRLTAQLAGGAPLATARFKVNTNWAGIGFDGRNNSFNPWENVLSATNAASVTQSWNFTPSSIDQAMSSPSVAGNLVYSGDHVDRFNHGTASLWAVDVVTGQPAWHQLIGSEIDVPPAVVNGTVIALDGTAAELDAFNAQTGQFEWHAFVDQVTTSAPQVVDGVIYVVTGDATFAFDASNGATLWQATVGGINTAAVANGVVYEATGTGVRALAAATGATLWQTTLGTESNDVSPSVASGLVYVGVGANLIALDAATGTQVWSFATQGNDIDTTPAIADGTVYLANNEVYDPNLYAISAATGTQQWATPVYSGYFSNPIVANGVVYIGSHGPNAFDYLTEVNASTGAVLATLPLGGQPTIPAISNGTVYIGSDTGLYAFTPPAGSPRRP